jgi:Na+/melibiose symporter-like transporter
MVPALVDYLRPDSQIIKLNAMGAVVLLPLLPITVLTLCAFPDRSKAPVRMTKAEKVPWRETWRAVTAEKTVFKVMLSDFAIVFAQGARGGLFIFYVGFVLGRPNLAATLFLFQFLFGILAAPIWQAISRRIGKHKALIVTELIQSAINLPLIFLGAGDVIIFMALATMQGLTQGSGNLILRAMLADVADEYRLRTGQDRTAMLFSAFSVSGKAGSAIPLGIALPLIAWFGFDPTAASIPSTGLMALALVFGLAPCFAHLVAAWLIRGFDIDEVKQGDIRRKLEARDASEAAAG